MAQITGLWIYDGNSSDVITKIHDNSVYCPFCRTELSPSLEGCTIYHLSCKNCGFEVIFFDQEEIWDRLLENSYKEAL